VPGTPDEPDSMSNKTVFFTMYIIGYLLCASYSACLTSFLAVKDLTLPFNNYHEMHHETNYKVVLIQASAYTSRLLVNTWYTHIMIVYCTTKYTIVFPTWILPYWKHYTILYYTIKAIMFLTPYRKEVLYNNY
jgi:hypothetical protein